MRPIFINARFLTQPVSGVQRYARELIGALDRRLADDPALAARTGPVTALHPGKPTMVDPPAWQVIRQVCVPGGSGHLWEQVSLARAVRNGHLLSLCGSGPIRHGDQLLVIHDSNVFVMPKAFSTGYAMFHRVLRPQLARRVARIASVSATAASDLSPYLRVPVAAIAVVPNSANHILGVTTNHDALAKFGLTAGTYLLTVGNQSPNKNIGRLVAAHATTDAPMLVIAGGFAPGVAQHKVAQVGRVRCLGRISDADLRALYEGALAFLWPALREGFGIPPLEAMALGVPVLSSRSTAMPEVLGDAALYFDASDSVDIARVIGLFMDLPEIGRAQMIAAGHRRAAAFSWDASVSCLIAAIQSVHPGQFR